MHGRDVALHGQDDENRGRLLSEGSSEQGLKVSLKALKGIFVSHIHANLIGCPQSSMKVSVLSVEVESNRSCH